MITVLLLLEDFDLVFLPGVVLTAVDFLLPKALRQVLITPLGLPLITVMIWAPFLPLDTLVALPLERMIDLPIDLEVTRPRERVAAFPEDLPAETPLELLVDVPLVLPLELPTDPLLLPPRLTPPPLPPLRPPPPRFQPLASASPTSENSKEGERSEVKMRPKERNTRIAVDRLKKALAKLSPSQMRGRTMQRDAV